MTASILPDDAHPLVRAGYEYWLAAVPEPGLLPGRRNIDPMDIPQLLPHVWLIDIHAPADAGNLPRFRFRLAGSHVDLGFGEPKTGRWLDEVEPGFSGDPARHNAFVTCARTGTPSHRRGRPHFRFNRNARELERVILPLAADGRTVDMLLGFTVFYDERGGILQSAL